VCCGLSGTYYSIRTFNDCTVATGANQAQLAGGGAGNPAKLLQHAQSVHEDAAVGHLASFEAIDHNAFDLDRFAGGRNAEKCVAVGAGPGETRDDLVALAICCWPARGSSSMKSSLTSSLMRSKRPWLRTSSVNAR
jgi:hypothetical protein